MIKTRLTELVGLKYPIIQAGMGPYPVTSLCIAAANAGCLGLCSTFATTSRETNPIVFEDFCKQAHAETTDDDVTIFKKMFTRVFEETKESDGIFGANVMVSAEVKANAMKVMQAIKELREADPEMKRRFRVLVTTAGDPMPWANFVKEQGMIWMHVFPGVRTAARCKKAGVQVLSLGCAIGAGSVVAESALVPQGKSVPPETLVAGIPAKPLRPLTQADRESWQATKDWYVRLTAAYLDPNHFFPVALREA